MASQWQGDIDIAARRRLVKSFALAQTVCRMTGTPCDKKKDGNEDDKRVGGLVAKGEK